MQQVGGVTYIIELDNIRVADLLEDSYLAIDTFQVSMILDLFFLKDFYCDLTMDKQQRALRNQKRRLDSIETI